MGLLIKNVRNLVQTAEAVSSQIEVLANSEAIQAYLKDGAAGDLAAMRDLSNLDVRFVACNHARQGLGIDPGQPASFVHIVPAGVSERIENRAEGYAYIKP